MSNLFSAMNSFLNNLSVFSFFFSMLVFLCGSFLVLALETRHVRPNAYKFYGVGAVLTISIMFILIVAYGIKSYIEFNGEEAVAKPEITKALAQNYVESDKKFNKVVLILKNGTRCEVTISNSKRESTCADSEGKILESKVF